MRIKKFSVTEMGTNCYIYQDEKTGRCAVIDPGEVTDELREAVELVGRDAFDYILLTHCHFDHAGGVAEFKKITGAPIAMYEKEAPGMTNTKVNLSGMFNIAERYPEPDIIFADGEKFKVGETVFTVIHTPGHTVGSCCFITAGLIFSGDTLFRNNIGRTDFPGGSMTDMKKSLRRLAELDGDYLIYPGHDLHTTLSSERMNNFYMQ